MLKFCIFIALSLLSHFIQLKYLNVYHFYLFHLHDSLSCYLLNFYASILYISKKYHNIFNYVLIIRYLAYLLVEASIKSHIINILCIFKEVLKLDWYFLFRLNSLNEINGIYKGYPESI